MKYFRVFPILAAVAAISLLAAVMPARPAIAAGILELDPNHGSISDRIDVWGGFFNPSNSVYIYFSSDVASEGDRLDDEVNAYERVVSSTATDANGELYTYFFVPEELTDGDDEEKVHGGTYYVYATYAGSRTIWAYARFTVETVGQITLDLEEGIVGTEVQVTGQGFVVEEAITVKYDGDIITDEIVAGEAATDENGEFELTIVIPESTAGEHTIVVSSAASGLEVEAQFTVEPEMTISPESGAAGETITATGTGFGNRLDIRVFFDGIEIAVDAVTDRDGSFEVSFAALARGPGTYDVEVEDEDGNSGALQFTLGEVTASLSADSGYAGTEVTVSGSGFQAGKQVPIIFDDELVATAVTDDYGLFSTSFTVPARAAGSYKVIVSDGTSIVEAAFSIGISASISPITSAASPGHIGSAVTVSGLGFMANSTVTVTYDGKQVATTAVGTDGAFSATFKAPASSGGQHTIVVSDPTNFRQFSFFMEATPPSIPVPLKPEMAIEAEAVTYFDWKDSTDVSGVTYTLQIATAEGFPAGSIVLEKSGLTESAYTITPQEELAPLEDKAPYYWHVRARDGAGNESQWSGTGTFYIASIFTVPQQIIYILFGVGALLFGIFGFWLGRRTAYY